MEGAPPPRQCRSIFLVKFMRVKERCPSFLLLYALDLSLVTRRHYPTLAKALNMMHIIYVIMSVKHERKKSRPIRLYKKY